MPLLLWMTLGAQVVSHDDQISGLIFAIFYPVGQQRLEVKAPSLTHRPGALVLGEHLRRDLSELQNSSERDNLSAQGLAEAPGLPLGSYVYRDFTDLP